MKVIHDKRVYNLRHSLYDEESLVLDVSGEIVCARNILVVLSLPRFEAMKFKGASASGYVHGSF